MERYFVKGLAGSVFEWKLVGPNGEDASQYLKPDPDSPNGEIIIVEWPTDAAKGGLYTFEVTETTQFGCEGAPWDQQFVILNNASIFVPFENVNQFFQVCEGGQTEIFPSNNVNDNYLWLDVDEDANTPYLTGEAGTYRVQFYRQFTQDHETYSSTFSCSFDTVTLDTQPLPVVDLGADTTLFGAQTLLLEADDPTFTTWEWYTFDYNNNQFNSFPASSGVPSYLVEGGVGNQQIKVYVETVYNDAKYYEPLTCSATDIIRIDAADYSNFRIPKAFVPGSLYEHNSRWYFPAPTEDGGQALYTYLNDVDVRVFNRWGKQVWESKGAYQPWDGRDSNGRPLPMDSYHYIIRIKVDGKVFLYKGSVTIIR